MFFTPQSRPLREMVIATSLVLSASSFAQTTVNPIETADAMEATNGKFEGYRRSGAKGVCASGIFTASVEARRLSTSTAFSGRPIPANIRFSIGGASPSAAENTKSQRNMAIEFMLPKGEIWRMGNISAPIFGAKSPEQFLGRVQSLQPDPTTKAADPVKVKAFVDANPEVLLQGKYFASQPVPASFTSVNYWGVHAFGFVNKANKTQYGKWMFTPTAGTQGLTDEEAKAKAPGFLFADLRTRIQSGPVTFDFDLQLAQDGDDINSAITPLPAERKKVNMGRLQITAVSPDATGACVTTNFDPNVVPKGIKVSSDPVLLARSSVYAVTLGRRLVEGAKQ